MSYLTPKLPRDCRQHRLAACVAAVVSLTAPAIALSVAVTNCNDVGPNSLRAAIANAATGDTIDLTGLTCSTITLEDLQIVIPQHDVTIKGPASGVTIAHDGNYDRVLNHQGTGTLSLENIHVTGGDPYSATHAVKGGCIYSKGSVYLENGSVTDCLADTYSQNAYGGGIYTFGDLVLQKSTISDNRSGSQDSSFGTGGGAHVGGDFRAISSSIRNNVALGAGGGSAQGGVGVYKSFAMYYSTISGNSANVAAGLAVVHGHPDLSGVLANSTISGNHASYAIGGAYLSVPTTVRNSTIAFNTALQAKFGPHYEGPGLAMVNNVYGVDVDLESTIISNNTYLSNGTTIESDFSISAPNTASVTVSGQHNLIVASSLVLPPNVVAVTSCPLLGPLRNNGGVTQTHALLSHSPAIDEGNNPSLETFDQRGSPYKRSDGLFANFTDIGAYEVQQEDVVFNAGFDGCAP